MDAEWEPASKSTAPLVEMFWSSGEVGEVRVSRVLAVVWSIRGRVRRDSDTGEAVVRAY